MLIGRTSVVACVTLLFLFTAPATAKGPVVKLLISGPDLLEPIEVIDFEAIDINLYGATFVDRALDRIEDVPVTPVPPYLIQFYEAMAPDDVQMRYVVYFAWDSSTHRARVYFPGRHEAWWRHNVFTVALPLEGAWYYTTESWGRAVHEAILAHNDPLLLAGQ